MLKMGLPCLELSLSLGIVEWAGVCRNGCALGFCVRLNVFGFPQLNEFLEEKIELMECALSLMDLTWGSWIR